jgi:hypothetical protein
MTSYGRNNIVQGSCGKQILSIGSYDLLSFMVGQSHDSLTLLGVENVIFFFSMSAGRTVQVLCTWYRQKELCSKSQRGGR